MSGEPIPVTVVGGYLGAGKTTLLNHVLRRADGVRFAVLVNDFGSINIDAELIESFDGETMQLANGCICCSLAGGFTEALFALRERRPRPDRVLVEASGVADPHATAQFAHLDGFELDGVLVVADVETVRHWARDRYVGRHVVRQLEHADLVILNKVDLVDPERLAAVREWVHHQSRESRVIGAEHAEVPLPFLFAAAGERRTPQTWAVSTVEGHADHETWTFRCEHVVGAMAFRALVAELPDSVIRAKGIVYLDDDPTCRHVFQLVGRRSTIRRGRPWGDESPSTRLVFIGPPHAMFAPLLIDAFAALDTGRRPLPTRTPS